MRDAQGDDHLEGGRLQGPRLVFPDGSVHALSPGQSTVSLGSRSDNTFVLQGEGISRYHAQLLLRQGTWWIEDLGARNGVLVDGERVVAPRPLEGGEELLVGELSLRFQNDRRLLPAEVEETLRQAARRWHAAQPWQKACAVGLVLLILVGPLLLGGDGSALPSVRRSGGGEATLEVQRGHAALLAGNYEEARTAYRRAMAQASSYSESALRDLSDLAAEWKHLQGKDGPRQFRWDKASEILSRAVRRRRLAPQVMAWLKEQRAFVELNEEAYSLFRVAEAQRKEAVAKVAAGELEAAAATYRKAAEGYRAVAPASLFGHEAQRAAREIPGDAFRLMAAHVRASAQAKEPRWERLLDDLRTCATFAGGLDDRVSLRPLRSLCRENLEDKRSYDTASKILIIGRQARFGEAVRLLKAIRATSRVYAQAQARLARFTARELLVEAKRRYDAGELEAALGLLLEARRSEHLGDADRVELRRLHGDWSRVAVAFDRARRASDENEEIAELARVAKLVPEVSHPLNRRARRRVVELRAHQEERFRAGLAKGVGALRKEDFVLALVTFEQLALDPNTGIGRLQTIERAVARYAERSDVLGRHKRLLHADERWAFPKLRVVFHLLSHWLPQGEDRETAGLCLVSVENMLGVGRAQVEGLVRR